MSIETRVKQSVTLLENLATEALVAAVVAAYFHFKHGSDAGYAVETAIGEVSQHRDQLAIEISGNANRKYDLYLSWTVRNLLECLSVIKQINIEKVAELVRQGQNTQALFEDKLLRLADLMDGRTSGVMACYKEVVTNSSRYDVRVVALMGSVKRIAKTIRRAISWLRRPQARWLIFALRPRYVVAGAACLFGCIYVAKSFQEAASINPEVVGERIIIDAARLAGIWRERDIGAFEKFSDTAELLYHLASIAPLLLLLSAVPLYAVRRFVIKSRSARSKLKETQRHIISAARLLGIKGLLIGEVNVKNVTTNVSGQGHIVNIAGYMLDVSNQVSDNLQRSSSPDEIKELVRTLTNQINAIADRVEPALTEKMGKSVKRISEEMAEPKPDRAWYELSLKGLKEAAEAVGAIAGPIVATVEKLTKLLLGL